MVGLFFLVLVAVETVLALATIWAWEGAPPRRWLGPVSSPWPFVRFPNDGPSVGPADFGVLESVDLRGVASCPLELGSGLPGVAYCRLSGRGRSLGLRSAGDGRPRRHGVGITGWEPRRWHRHPS